MRSIVMCTTCRFPGGQQTDATGLTGGQTLIAAMRALLAELKRDDVNVEEQVCLWNCTQSCSVAFRDPERFSYITGRHHPTREQAQAILEWFDAHGATERGEVPFREWPPLMKGHFIARIPPMKKVQK